MQRLVPLAALAALAAAGVQGAAQGDDPVRQSGPELLTYAELLELSETAQPAGDPAGKLERLLNTPFISNQAYYRGARPKRPSRVELGPVLRAAMWNIERGSEFDLISASFHDSETFARLAAERTAHGPEAMDAIRAEAHLLKGSDVILLNEVDFGMTRTDYRDVTRQLAEALDMNTSVRL